MRKIKILTAVAAFAALAVPSAASAATSQLNPQQWDIGTTQVTNAAQYLMKNTVNGSHIGYDRRRFGIDLGWVKRGAWVFKRQMPAGVRDNRSYPLTEGEPVALYNTNARMYVTYGRQTWGINLKLSRTPVYDWKFDVDATGKTSLFNTTANDFVVYGQRPSGINLRWLKDVIRDQPPSIGSIHDASVTLRAQPVVQGYIPFYGTYGGGLKAALTKVSNPWNNVTFLFVKPGKSTNDCGNSSAVVPLGPNKTMTADEMKAAFGTATPALPAQFVTCVASSTSLSSIPLNIQYRITG